MERTLQDLFRVFGDRRVVVARELTKMHEETLRANLADLAAEKGRKWRGEVTLVVAGCPQDKDKESED
jgi:16S rRNA (cytidine1402-2'-O)-methyltransferase